MLWFWMSHREDIWSQAVLYIGVRMLNNLLIRSGGGDILF
jgi:hypothetical protein